MTTPSSGPISLLDIQTEFGGVTPIGLDEYYAGGVYVIAGTAGIPSSGQIAIGDFYNKSAVSYTITPAANNINESGTLSISVGGTNITDGTYYWTINHITSNSADFSANSGSFSISSNSGSFSVAPSADNTTEGSEIFTITIRSGSTSGTALITSSSITINDTSITPVYNESFSISPGTVSLSDYTTISISGGQPNATFEFSVLNNADPQPSSYAGTASLNASGNFSNYITGATITGGSTGNKRIWVYFPYNGNVRNAAVNVVADPAAGTVLNEYCLNPGVSPYTHRQVIANGTGGSNNSDTNYSTSCGYIAAGTLQSSSCLSYGNAPYTLRNVRYNGPDATYGTYNQDINNSPSCGYTPPPTATWYAEFSNNGSAGAIYCGVVVNLSGPTPTTVTFYFSGVVQDNGAGFNVPSVTITAGNTASAGYEYSGFTNGSAPYSSLTLVVSPSSSPYSISPGSTSYPGFLYS
jgi:hypothetical protein